MGQWGYDHVDDSKIVGGAHKEHTGRREGSEGDAKTSQQSKDITAPALSPVSLTLNQAFVVMMTLLRMAHARARNMRNDIQARWAK